MKLDISYNMFGYFVDLNWEEHYEEEEEE